MAIKQTGPSKKLWCKKLGSTITRKFRLLPVCSLDSSRNSTVLQSIWISNPFFAHYFCSEANAKGVFFRIENALWMKISARAGCQDALSFFISSDLCTQLILKTLYSEIVFICQFLKTMLNHKQNLFSLISNCFCLFGEFADVFDREVWRVQVAPFHSAYFALSISRLLLFILSFVISYFPYRILNS